MAAELDNFKLGGIAQLFPELQELVREKPPKQWADTHACEIIALLADAIGGTGLRACVHFTTGGDACATEGFCVIPILWMIERQFHEPLECDAPAARFHLAPDFTK